MNILLVITYDWNVQVEYFIETTPLKYSTNSLYAEVNVN